MQNHISVELSGRLGNHLFLISAAAVAARENKRDLHVFNADGKDAEFTLRCVSTGMARVGLNFCTSRMEKSTEIDRVQEHDGCLSYEAIVVPKGKNVCISGFRQNYNYFAAHRSWILDHVFSIPCRRAQALQNFGLPSLAGKIVVHVRRGDYVSGNMWCSLVPISTDRYYVEALRQVAKTTGLREAVLFCEEESREDVSTSLLPLLQKVVPHVSINFAPAGTKKHDAWHEMLWMSSASAFVVANSTFSWWAALMSPAKADQKVVAYPKEWTGLGWIYKAREMAQVSADFGRWFSVSGRMPTQVKDVICGLGIDFAARMCSVADDYTLAPYDETSCGVLDRDFSFSGNHILHRKVCAPLFCVIDTTQTPLVDGRDTNNFSFQIFTSIDEFLQSHQENRWVFFRMDASSMVEHIFNDMWFLMQPRRFGIDTNPSKIYKYCLRYASYNLFAVTETSLRKTEVRYTEWWRTRPGQYFDVPDKKK